MAVTVFGASLLLQTASQLIILIIKVLCGAAIYLGLMIYNQIILLVEIKNIVLNREFAVEKYQRIVFHGKGDPQLSCLVATNSDLDV